MVANNPWAFAQWHSLCGRGIEINIEYRTRNHEFRMKAQDTSSFDIPCSVFNIQKKAESECHLAFAHGSNE